MITPQTGIRFARSSGNRAVTKHRLESGLVRLTKHRLESGLVRLTRRGTSALSKHLPLVLPVCVICVICG
jgi:hypothetical protein